MFENLRKALDKKKITDIQYSRYLGISKRSLYYRLSGEREFTLKEIEKTSELLKGYKWEYLFKR